MGKEGLISVVSSYSVPETIDRFKAEIEKRGMTVFARIDHKAGADAVGMALRPTEVLIFGNAKAGTPLMQAKQTIGIDLPLKVLAWQDEKGKVYLSYNDLLWLGARHELPDSEAEQLKTMKAGLEALVAAAIHR